MENKEILNTEAKFYDVVENIKKQLGDLSHVDVIIGIPLFNEIENLKDIIHIASESLKHDNVSKLVVCIGDQRVQDIIDNNIKKSDFKGLFGYTMPSGISERGYYIRAILEIARYMGADLVVLETDLEKNSSIELKDFMIERVLKPVAKDYDMAIGRFRRHPFENMSVPLFFSPLYTCFYSTNLIDPISGIFAMSHDFVEEFCIEFDQFHINTAGYGINQWIITTACKKKKAICEVDLGAKQAPTFFGKQDIIFKDMLKSFFECIKRDEEIWLKDGFIISTPDYFMSDSWEKPADVISDISELIASFKHGFYNYRDFLNVVLDNETLNHLASLAKTPLDSYNFPLHLWAEIVYDFILAFGFCHDIDYEDLFGALAIIFDGVSASYIKQISVKQKSLPDKASDEKILYAKATDMFDKSVRTFLKLRQDFIIEWNKKAEKTRPVITPLDYLEFIPGIPIVLPKKISGPRKKVITTGDVFKRLQKKYKDEFEDFMHSIGIDTTAPPSYIGKKYMDFMSELEKTVDKLCPGDLFTVEGTKEVAKNIFNIFPHRSVTAVKWEVLRKLLFEFPPGNLVLRLGMRNMRELLDSMDVRDILTLAQFTEDKDYFDRIFLWLEDNLRPDSFEQVELKTIVVERNNFPGVGELKEVTDLNRLTARIAVTNLGKGMGGNYPNLRYFTRICKSIVEAEHFSDLWISYIKERKEVGRKFTNSILGHYGKALFSCHRIFENFHHRELVIRLKILAKELELKNEKDASKMIDAMAKGHGLNLVLKDGTFLPCSAWTWASFSFKGGEGIPTPLFLHVERDWFNHDLLEEIYKEMGYNPKYIMNQVFQFISQGRESVDLIDTLLGVKPSSETIVVQELDNWPEAEQLKRYAGNPILDPIPEHWWENKYVLNAAAIRIKDKVYLLYRAFGQDKISRIGLAISDGYRIIKRFDKPIFVPERQEERMGCEDPRVVIIDNEIIMLYTAYDGVVAQIAAASIAVKDFLNGDFDKWKRRGYAFPGLWNKDAILIPERIDGKYAIYHRIEPSIWMAYSDELVFPWPTQGHKIVMGPRSGMMWDSAKIGAGSQPIKTRYGWLMIYHGVDQEMYYRLGVILVDLNNPERLLYRSPNPVLSPETECEIGEQGCWVPNVVFTCGAVPAVDKEILDDEDEILVYYGAADTNICLATGKVKGLIPEKIRMRIKQRT